MKTTVRFRVICSLLICAIAALYIAGCQSSSPSLLQQTSQAKTAYSGVVRAIDVEVVNGRIKTPDYHRYIEPSLDAIEGALSVMDATATKDAAQWQAAFDSFNKALSELNVNKAKVESPATAPASPQAKLLAVPARPIEAGIPLVEVIALIGIGFDTVKKMVEEGRQETTDEETQQLADATAVQLAARAQLDADVARLDQQQQDGGSGSSV